jgi:hypothetical protein
MFIFSWLLVLLVLSGRIGKVARILGAISLIIFHGFLDVDSIRFWKGYLWSFGIVALDSPSTTISSIWNYSRQ